MSDVFRFSDDLGPVKIIHVSEPSTGLKAILVIDNIARGPALGGVRLAKDVSLEECFRLARAMTFKNAAADLPHGGGKMVIFCDPVISKRDKEQLLRCLAQLLKNETDYIFGPDMGTDERAMAWIRDEVDRVAGLPREIGGIPLDEIGATGWGLRHAAEVASEHLGMSLDGARVVVQGLGAVGRPAARFLQQQGARLVAVSDSRGAIASHDGLDLDRLLEIKSRGGSVIEYKGADKITAEQLISVPSDIWIPAARPDVINENNMSSVNTRMIIEGANIPVSIAAERWLHEKNILCIPDFIANAGGVICAAMEYQGAGESGVMEAIEYKIRRNTIEVLDRADKNRQTPREAAEALARARVESAMQHRRWRPFSSSDNFT